MLNAFASKCSKKCQHNVQKPNERAWAQGSGKSAILFSSLVTLRCTLVFNRLSALGRLCGTEGNYGKY